MVCYHALPSGPYVSTAFCCSVRSSRPGKSQFRNLSNELKCDEHLPRDSRNCMLNVWCMNGQLLEWKCVLWGATADFDNSHSTTICDRVSPSSSWGSRPHKAPPTPKQQRELTSASHDCSNIFFPFFFLPFSLFLSLSLFFPLSLSLHWVFWVWMDLPTSFSQSKRIQGEKLASLLQRWHASAVQLMSFWKKHVAIDPQIVYFGWPLHSTTNLWEKDIIRTS